MLHGGSYVCKSVLISATACLLMVTGCKKQPRPQSELGSIETIAQDQSIKNRDFDCGYRKGKPASLAGAQSQYERVVKAEVAGGVSEERLKDFLITIPDLLLDALRDNGGKVILRQDAVDFCIEKFNELAELYDGKVNGLIKEHVTARARDLKGCWYAPANGVSNIYLAADEEAINDGLLPLFAYHYVEKLNERVLDSALKEKKIKSAEHQKLMAAQTALASFRKTLVEALFADLAAAKRDDVVKRLQNDFGLGTATTNLDAKAIEALGNMVFAESTDSYYCAKESFASFAGSTAKGEGEVAFPTTFQRYAPMAEVLGSAWHSL